MTEDRPLVLLTNDDGIASEGLLALKQALSAVAVVLVVAPQRDWSVIGHAKSMRRPLQVSHVTLPDGDIAHVTDGTPVDCVAMGMLGLLPRRPDLVVSGINKGPNLGEDILYSGTVAAAVEGLIWGVPSLAFSCADHLRWDFSAAAEFAPQVLLAVVENGLRSDVLLNINVPSAAPQQVHGVAVTHLSRRTYNDTMERHLDQHGQQYYVIAGAFPGGVAEDGGDYAAVQAGLISVTPIHLDLTNHSLLGTISQWGMDERWGLGRLRQGGRPSEIAEIVAAGLGGVGVE